MKPLVVSRKIKVILVVFFFVTWFQASKTAIFSPKFTISGVSVDANYFGAIKVMYCGPIYSS